MAMRFEIVRSRRDTYRGLSGRADIPAGYGMLFAFGYTDMHAICMRDMLKPIDIIWLEADGAIAGVTENCQPASWPETTFYPPRPVRFVLETRVGEAKAQGWVVGSVVPLPTDVL